MRVKFLPVSIALFSFVLLSAPSFAITGSIEATVPFAFHVGKDVLPPAAYIFDVVSTNGAGVLEIRAKETGKRVMIDTDELPEKADPRTVELVFDNVGNNLFLTEIWGLVDTGRAIKRNYEGAPLARASEENRKHIPATRVVN